jgi:hypothetical protein
VRLALALGALAVVLSAGALAFTVVRSISGAPNCQSLAWDSAPAAENLPAGWAIATSNFFVGSLTATLDGPASTDETSDGSIFATVTCYAGDAAEALARSRAADADTAGNTVAELDLGDVGYSVGNESSGTTAMHFMRDDLTAHLAVSGSVAEEDLFAVAEAFDLAIRDARAGRAPSAAPGQAEIPPENSAEPIDELPLESDLPEESPVAPELEAMLPTVIDGAPFIANSANGADVPADTPGSRALMASLRAMDKTPADLQVAEAYDESETLDLYLLAFRLPGEDGAVLREMILESWLSANAAGVTQEPVTLADKEFVHVSYGDEDADAYVFTNEDAVIIVHTADAALAEAAAAALP